MVEEKIFVAFFKFELDDVDSIAGSADFDSDRRFLAIIAFCSILRFLFLFRASFVKI